MQNKELIMHPIVSIVAGIYFPPELCFRRFLDACLNQTLTNLEFILILDSPLDKQSREILKEYTDKFEENKNSFRIIENPTNLGVVDTYIKGCELAESDTLLIVDSDDFFDNDLISQMYTYFIDMQLDFLAPRILMSYLGELDVFYALNNNDDPDDTGIMFKKELLNTCPDFARYINYTSIKTLKQNTLYKVDTLPLYLGSFYYYTITNRSATSSFILQDTQDIPKSREYDEYKQGVINFIETFFSNTLGKKIKFTDYSIPELKTLAMQYLDVDNCLKNDFTYEELKGI
jgi:glycosyltransferase involved in cell wall biosynthesis